jgi:hypothetical protein
MIRRVGCGTGYCLVALLAACGQGSSEDDSAAVGHEQPELGVALDADQRDKLGVEIGAAQSATFAPSVEGPARVADAQLVIGAMAELGQAEADVRTSQAALKRARDLFNNDAAVSAETLEAAERQAAADEARLRVARARATLSFGASAPWLDAARRETLLAALSAGSTLLVSASFPSGLADMSPSVLSVRRAGAAAESFSATEVWAGPADAGVPGPTLLALLPVAADLSVGERLTASVAAGAPLAGVVVPLSAVVLAGGEPWCYVQTEDELFVRRRVDLGRPLPLGYFQAQGYAAGEPIVVAGAGLLLARETGGGAEED